MRTGEPGTFAEFWSVYPPRGAVKLRMGKREAEAAYNVARKEFSHEVIMACLRLMLAAEWNHKDPQYIPFAHRWLQKRPFADMPQPTNRESYELPLFSGHESVPERSSELGQCEFCTVPNVPVRLLHGKFPACTTCFEMVKA